jgi:hypothetical protein
LRSLHPSKCAFASSLPRPPFRLATLRAKSQTRPIRSTRPGPQRAKCTAASIHRRHAPPNRDCRGCLSRRPPGCIRVAAPTSSEGNNRLEPAHPSAILRCAIAASIKRKNFLVASDRGQFRPGGETPTSPGQSGPFGAIQRLTSNVIHSKFFFATLPSVCRLAARLPRPACFGRRTDRARWQ